MSGCPANVHGSINIDIARNRTRRTCRRLLILSHVIAGLAQAIHPLQAKRLFCWMRGSSSRMTRRSKAAAA